MPKLLISVDGWSATTVGILGSGNHWTPTIDGIGIHGTVANRFIRSIDQIDSQMLSWHDDATLGNLRRVGPVVVITDRPDLEQQAAELDEMRLLSDSIGDDGSNEPMVPRLFAEAFERLSTPPLPSLVWIHVRRLLHHWDAVDPEPFQDETNDEPVVDELGVDELAVDEAFADDASDPDADGPSMHVLPRHVDAHDASGELIDRGQPASMGIAAGPLEVPHFDLDGTLEDDPDARFRWLQRYGTQVQSIDQGLTDLLATGVISSDQVALFGTSGFQIGAGGFFGHRGPLVRTSDLHVPLVLGGLDDSWRIKRIEMPFGDATFRSLLRMWVGSNALDQTTFVADDPPAVVTSSDRAEIVRTTPRWFYVKDFDGSERLYLKPDDAHDVNDVASLREDVLREMRDHSHRDSSDA